MVHSHAAKILRAGWLSTAVAVALAASPAASTAAEGGFSWGGNLALTTDYIYRGLSESDGRAGAIQADLHADTTGGTFGGVWASTRDPDLEPGARYDAEIYLGHRIDLASAWSATLSARSRYFLGGAQEASDDFQEISGTVTWLDRWSLSITAIPRAVRYWYYRRQSRSPAWIGDTAGQWQLGELLGGALFLTAGTGYYRSTGTGPGRFAATGYAYGNAGLALERRRWRLDVGYFLTGNQAQELFPYPIANHHVAGTLSWHF